MLLNRLPQGERGELRYGVYLDNLFTSTKLLACLADHRFGAMGTARKTAGIHGELTSLKERDKKDIITWESKYRHVVAEGRVVQLGWKDLGFTLFHSNMEDCEDETITERHRPKATASCAKTACEPFGNTAVINLPRPTLTFNYNINMNMVDRGDQ